MKKENAFPNIVIRASAGTGKTYQLAVRFIGLLASGARPDEILATTFTRKAAGEILDRVLSWLAVAATDSAKRSELAEKIGKPLSPEQCREMFVAIVRRLHTLRVGTLDSYFLQVATSFGHELGLPPGWSICDELADWQIRDEAIELLLTRGKLADLLTLVHSLTKGAASRSVARLARDTVTGLFEMYRETSADAWKQISVCKGLEAHELDDVIGAIASLELPAGQFCTTRDKDVEKARLANWEGLIASGFAAKVLAKESTFNRKPLPPELISAYWRLLQHVESILVGQIARQTLATYELLQRYAEHYHVLQLEERALRFSDVTFRLADAASRIGREAMAFRLDGGIRHLLLDEFQDTSPPQWRVIRPLAAGVVKGRGGSFFCVGDGKQAIYGWRGGVAEIFDCLEDQLPGLTDDQLTQSYRSSQPVVDAVNQVFRNLAQHPHLDQLAAPVQRWQAAFPKHSTALTKLQGHVTLSVAPEPAEGIETSRAVLQHAADLVRALHNQAPAASIGVLVRTNDAVAKLIFELRSRGIAASEEGGNPLIDSPAVELILSILKLADHPGDSVARFHLANSPLSASLKLADHDNDAVAVELSQRMRRQLLDDGYGATIFHYARQLAISCDERDLSRLQQLVELAYEYQSANTLRTSDFLKLVTTRRIADPQAANVRVMTIHQAKGLEFDAVLLPELEGRLVGQPDRFVAGRPSPTEPVNIVCRLADKTVRQFFPPALQKLFDDDMCLEVSESLCVLYVAMTRAVHALHMILAPSKPNEKSMPKTFAGLLRTTLGPTAPAMAGKTLYEHGDAAWYGSTQTRSVSEGLISGRPDKPDSQPSRLPPKSKIQNPKSDAARSIQLAPAAKHRPRNWERTSPSSLEGGAQLRAATIIAPKPPHVFGLGTLFHAWLAEISWLDESDSLHKGLSPRPGTPGRGAGGEGLSDNRLREIATRLRATSGISDDQLDSHIARFRQQLTAKPIAALLSRSYYQSPTNLGLPQKAWPSPPPELTAFPERTFALHHDQEKLLTGSIDRLIVISTGGKTIAADIIDFKTDDITSTQKSLLAEKIDFYRPQLEAYRNAAADLLKIDHANVGAGLVFLQSGILSRL
ncbi:MAG TPA: UvrD-helicase domain-containing protein [Pirellulaceae bacterium]|jgi:ATP-dependent exoDNAse (exonuclease V) beta subunit